jgi:hypothetical protein
MQLRNRLFNNLQTLSRKILKSQIKQKIVRKKSKKLRSKMMIPVMQRMKTRNSSIEYSWTRRELKNTKRI